MYHFLKWYSGVRSGYNSRGNRLSGGLIPFYKHLGRTEGLLYIAERERVITELGHEIRNASASVSASASDPI